MTSSRCAVGRGSDASVSIGREPRRRGVTNRTLLQGHNVVHLAWREIVSGIDMTC